MTALEDPKIKATLARLHNAARGDWLVFLRALPAVAVGALTGHGVMESAKPYLKNAYIPIDAAQGRALYQFARMSGARTIVEFGCSFGISAIYLAAALRDNGGGRVITTELEPKKIEAARANFAAAGVDGLVELREGDAMETLRDVAAPVDLFFLDGWKELCLPVLKLMEPKLKPGAAVFCDDMKGFRRTLKPYTDYVRDPRGGYVSMALPLGDELEFSVRA
jgi:predicted O-methyltransferase YrrM